MTKIMFSADHHFDESKPRRFEECQRIHNWMVEQARARDIDAFVSCGDVYERASTPTERQAVAMWLQAMADVCPVYVVKGNHDRRFDCALMARLKAKHPITVCEDIAVHDVGSVKLGLVAWPDRANILRWARERGLSPDLAEHDALRALLQGLRLQMHEHDILAGRDMPSIVAGHFAIEGALTSPGQPLIGQAMGVNLGDFDLTGASLVVAGHIHKPQDWSVARVTPVLYTGSPYRTAYGETEQKSVLLVRTGMDGALSWDRIPTPCAAMHLVEGRWDGMDFGPGARVGKDVDVSGSEIRLRYHVTVDDRLPAAATANDMRDAWLEQGASNVKIDEMVEASTRARTPEITSALSLPDKLALLWRARNDTPEAARCAQLISMASELQEAVL